MITIAVVCNFSNDRRAIISLLMQQEDFRIMHSLKDSYDVLRSAGRLHPDIIIMDFRLEGIDSSDLAPIIKRKSPSTAFIVLCSQEKNNTVTKVLKAGISGYLIRDEGYDNLASSVRSVFHGGLYISKSARDLALDQFSEQSEQPEPPPDINCSRCPLTSTEQSILSGITRGFSDREIAKNLNIKIGSLRNCVNRVKKKTGLRNRSQIIIFAMLAGKITVETIKKHFYRQANS
ncbi:MAG: response regulator transcription factor [Treponema sp.]|nr:response regulator transcription factor [Treponema sp.]